MFMARKLADLFNRKQITREDLKRIMLDIYGLLEGKNAQQRHGPLNEITNYVAQESEKQNLFTFIRNINNPEYWG